MKGQCALINISIDCFDRIFWDIPADVPCLVIKLKSSVLIKFLKYE